MVKLEYICFLDLFLEETNRFFDNEFHTDADDKTNENIRTQFEQIYPIIIGIGAAYALAHCLYNIGKGQERVDCAEKLRGHINRESTARAADLYH